MINKRKIVAVIPARGGSKGIKNKNLLKLNGISLTEIAIKESLKSKLIDSVILSSNSNKILNIGRKFKNLIIHQRKKNLSNDKSQIVDVLIDILNTFSDYDIIVLLQPTNPFRRSKDIDECIRKMIKGKYQTAITVSELDYDPRWFFEISPSGSLKPILKKFPKSTNRQDKGKFFKFSGNIYISHVKWLKSKKTFVSNRTLSYLVKNQPNIDIDNSMDFELAKLTLKKI